MWPNSNVTFILTLNPENPNKTTLPEVFFLYQSSLKLIYEKSITPTPKDKHTFPYSVVLDYAKP